jgi:RimJ/RimL family protein N-acetyltransferase
VRLEARESPDSSELWLNWAARSGDAYVGLIELTVASDCATIAYFIFTAWQRRGFAREACRAVLDSLGRRGAVRLVDATVDDRNEASLALLRSLGFQEIRRVPNADFFKGRTSDEVVMRYVFPSRIP